MNALLPLALFLHSVVADPLALARFASWKLQHARRYSSREEAATRLGYFLKNAAFCAASNARNLSYTLDPLNLFGDLSPAEFAARTGVSLSDAAPEPLPVAAT